MLVKGCSRFFGLVNLHDGTMTVPTCTVCLEVSGRPTSSSSSTDSADVAATNLAAERMQKEQRVEQPEAGLECALVGCLGLVFVDVFAVQAKATLTAWISAIVAFEAQETHIVWITGICRLGTCNLDELLA